MRADRRGAVLLEVLVAMVIFTIAAAASLARAAEARHAVALARAQEERIEAASAFMDRVALWPVEDLDRHLGAHQQGPWLLDVERPGTSIYALALFDSTGRQSLVRTLVYRKALR